MESYELIDGYQKVIEHFGQWPSFHDGEVHRFSLDRTRKSEGGAFIPCIEMDLRGWLLTGNVTSDGYLEMKGDAVVRFEFEDVSDVELDGFNHQNVIDSLKFEALNDGSSSNSELRVQLDHCFGLCGEFRTQRARVLSIEPWAGRNDG